MVTESAGSHLAVGHDGSLIHGLHMASEASFDGGGIFMEFLITQFGCGSQKTVAQAADHHHSY